MLRFFSSSIIYHDLSVVAVVIVDVDKYNCNVLGGQFLKYNIHTLFRNISVFCTSLSPWYELI